MENTKVSLGINCNLICEKSNVEQKMQEIFKILKDVGMDTTSFSVYPYYESPALGVALSSDSLSTK